MPHFSYEPKRNNKTHKINCSSYTPKHKRTISSKQGTNNGKNTTSEIIKKIQENQEKPKAGE